MNETSLPPIRVTAADFDRLEQLLDSPACKGVPGIEALREELERADIVEADSPPGEFVAMGSTARFIDDASGRTFELTLVYPHEVDGSNGRVSILAPAGSALLGLGVGQTIEWPIPGGRTLRLRVLEIAGL